MEKTGNKNVWIQTFSGKQYFPLAPDQKDVDIADIAHALSMTCRFTGHCIYFYSVGEHCVRVSDLAKKYVLDKNTEKGKTICKNSSCCADTIRHRKEVEKKSILAAKYGLAHDFSEAYVADLNRPTKGAIVGYKETEELNEKVIFEKFGLAYPIPEEIVEAVKWADNVMLATEARDLMVPPPQPWNLPEKADNKMIVPMTQQEAKAKFLETFYELFGQGENNGK